MRAIAWKFWKRSLNRSESSLEVAVNFLLCEDRKMVSSWLWYMANLHGTDCYYGIPDAQSRLARAEKTTMAIAEIKEFLKIMPAVRKAPGNYLWSSYDAEADVLYINFKKPSHASDSEITDDDIVIRYEKNGEVVGLTVLHASKR